MQREHDRRHQGSYACYGINVVALVPLRKIPGGFTGARRHASPGEQVWAVGRVVTERHCIR
jgi:hypothetical protein